MGFKQYLAYSASAGSGKTYALSIRYLALLFLGESPSSILAATFTKKAANEMKQRVLHFLNILPSDKNILNSLAEASGLSKEEILAKQNSVLQNFLRAKNHIVTLDSFFNSILRATALNIGLDSTFSIKNSAHDSLDELFIQELNSSGKIDSLVSLSINLHKRKAQDITELLNLLYQIDAILPNLEYKVEPLEALQEDIEKTREQLKELVVTSGASNSAIKNFEKIDFKEFIKKSVFDKSSLLEHRNYKKYVEKNPEIDRVFLELKSKIASYHTNLESTIFHYLFSLYNAYKIARLDEAKANSELDFSDILYYTYRLISHEVTKDFIYFKLDTKFKHILLDEFQDTSSLQYLILEPLIEEIFAGVGQSDFRSFFYVGDTKQSLYRFRGGVEELFGYVAKRFGVKIESLDTNYRSAKNIVDFTNKTFANKIDGYIPQKAFSSVGGFVEVSSCDKEFLLERAKEKVVGLLEKGVALSDIAILVYTNKNGVALQEYLKKHNIDSILKTSSSLKYNPKVASLVSVLNYAIEPNRLFLEPFMQKIGAKELNVSWLGRKTEPFFALDRLVKENGYFDSDVNILKLLDFAKSYSTIDEFLEEFQRSEISLAKNSVDGLSIMTIHGSKGLEFNYVILLDRLGSKGSGSSMLLFKNQDAVSINRVFYRHSKKENFVLDYAKALEQEKELSHKDRLNLLYVAITRAELGLSIIKKDKSSEFDILELQDGSLGEIVLPEAKDKKELEPLLSTISSYGKQDVSEQEPKESSTFDYSAIYFGEALHLALELSDISSANSKSAIQSIYSRYGTMFEQSTIDEIKKRVEHFLNSKFLKELLEGATIYKEQSISYKEKFYQIDLLLKKENLNIVLDYKSSKKFSKKHIEQVKNYIEAVKSIDNKECKGYIVYLLGSGVEVERVS